MPISLSGLDLSFMQDWEPPPREVKKREPNRRGTVACPFLMGDIKAFVSPVDGSEITSRSKLREHEVKHDIRQAGDFKPGEIIAQQNKRQAHSVAEAEGVKSEWVD